jgi:predicted molibdopterin-dependent oxidoreductase YjgC
VHVTWRRSEKLQPPTTKFRVPATDAPNVNGARDLGYNVGPGNGGVPDLTAFRNAIAAGSVQAVYVIDPGPQGSIGDVTWLIEARRSRRLPLLVVQGVEMTPLAAAADFVLPGAAYVEKDAIYTNEEGRVQATSAAIVAPGDAREDWQILVNLGKSLGLALPFSSANDVRRAIAAAMPGPAYAETDRMVFTRPITARNWLQASNPSERWKWDFMFQDLPPVKGHSVQTEQGLVDNRVIPLKPVG